MGIAAILLAATRFWLDWWEHSPGGNASPAVTVFWALYCIWTAGLITVAACALRWRWRGDAARLEPGEWIAIISASQSIVQILFGSWLTIQFESPDRVAATVALEWLTWCGVVLELGWAIVLVYLAWTKSETRSWRVAFASLAISQLTGPVTHFIYWSPLVSYLPGWDLLLAIVVVYSVISWSSAIAVCVAAIIDFRHGRLRRWTHWCAVSLFVVELVVQEIAGLWE
jgi:hypothetical protein